MLKEADYSATPESTGESHFANILTKGTDVRIPDQADTAWLEEKKKLMDAQRFNDLPFGREQRTVLKKVRLADEFAKSIQTGHDSNDRMKILEQAAKDGLAASADGKLTLQTEVGKLIAATKNIGSADSKKLSKILKPLNISRDHTKEFKKRFISKPELKTVDFRNKVITFLLVNAKNKGKPMSQFELDSGSNLVEKKKIAFDTASKKMKDEFYIDLKLNGIVPIAVAVEEARLTGEDLNGFKLPRMPANFRDPDVIPLGIIQPVGSMGKSAHDRQFTGIDIRGLSSGIMAISPASVA
tara:strand:- start:627 stop:1520 length:894 start_codon:yes stop_codon:yes gene_type:complete